MPRIARVVIPNVPHHVIQRGNRRQRVFFSDYDRQAYLDFLRIYAKVVGNLIWAYCLMDNHVHLLVVPKSKDSLALGFSDAHRRYSRMVNFREKWRGYLWEGRFKSYPMSSAHLYTTLRYIERNPVRAGIVKNAWDYRWSSARAHVFKQSDALLDDSYLTTEINDWKAFVSEEDASEEIEKVNHYARTGRPLGDDAFIATAEQITGRILHKQKPGPKL